MHLTLVLALTLYLIAAVAIALPLGLVVRHRDQHERLEDGSASAVGADNEGHGTDRKETR